MTLPPDNLVIDGGALHRAVEQRFETEQIPFLAALVDKPSHTYAKDDVEAAFTLLDDKCARLGLVRSLHPDPSGKFAAHRVYQTPAAVDGKPAWGLVGHMDTVFPRKLGFLHYLREGDRIRGPGTLDMKSGLSSIVFALQAIHDVRPDRFDALPIRFICVSDEEVGSPSSASLYASLAPALVGALVFEAGREADRIVVARKGAAAFRIEAKGRAAHAGNRHHDGVNAIHALSLLIPRLEALTDYQRGVTVNVGLMEGGTAKNTVPEQASCTIDARFLTVADGIALEAKIGELVRSPWQGVSPAPGTRLADATFTLSGGISRPPMEAHAANDALRLRYEKYASAVGLKVGSAPLQGGGSDANLLAAAGVPAIDGLGPYGQHFHQVEEWSSLSSLLRRTQALAAFLASEPTPH